MIITLIISGISRVRNFEGKIHIAAHILPHRKILHIFRQNMRLRVSAGDVHNVTAVQIHLIYNGGAGLHFFYDQCIAVGLYHPVRINNQIGQQIGGDLGLLLQVQFRIAPLIASGADHHGSPYAGNDNAEYGDCTNQFHQRKPFMTFHQSLPTSPHYIHQLPYNKPIST